MSAAGSPRARLVRVFALDLRSLALFRIALALLLLCDLFIRALWLRAHYTDEGIFPRATARAILKTNWIFSVHWLGGGALFEGALFALAAVFALMLLAGWRTRLAAVLSWLMLLSLQNRNWIILQGGDELLRLLCFWAMFLPLGARFSADALRKNDEPSRGPVFSAAAVGLVIQLLMMYVFAGLLKLVQPAWRQDLGLVYAFSLREYATGPGLALARHVALLKRLCAPALWAETLGALLILSPAANGACRLAALALFWGFHLANSTLLRIGHFSAVSMAAWLPLLPPGLWDGARAPLPEPERQWRPLSSSLLALACGYCLLWNVASLPGVWPGLPQAWRDPGWLLGLDQDWNMFSAPIVDDGWYVIPARLAGGGEVDLFRGGAPVSWEQPESISALFPTTRWAKYGQNLYQQAVYQQDVPPRPLLEAYGKYLCRDWNRSHSGSGAVSDLQVLFMRQLLRPDGGHEETVRVPLWSEHCLTPPGGPIYVPGVSPGITKL